MLEIFPKPKPLTWIPALGVSRTSITFCYVLPVSSKCLIYSNAVAVLTGQEQPTLQKIFCSIQALGTDDKFWHSFQGDQHPPVISLTPMTPLIILCKILNTLIMPDKFWLQGELGPGGGGVVEVKGRVGGDQEARTCTILTFLDWGQCEHWSFVPGGLRIKQYQCFSCSRNFTKIRKGSKLVVALW